MLAFNRHPSKWMPGSWLESSKIWRYSHNMTLPGWKKHTRNGVQNESNKKWKKPHPPCSSPQTATKEEQKAPRLRPSGRKTKTKELYSVRTFDRDNKQRTKNDDMVEQADKQLRNGPAERNPDPNHSDTNRRSEMRSHRQVPLPHALPSESTFQNKMNKTATEQLKNPINVSIGYWTRLTQRYFQELLRHCLDLHQLLLQHPSKRPRNLFGFLRKVRASTTNPPPNCERRKRRARQTDGVRI